MMFEQDADSPGTPSKLVVACLKINLLFLLLLLAQQAVGIKQMASHTSSSVNLLKPAAMQLSWRHSINQCATYQAACTKPMH